MRPLAVLIAVTLTGAAAADDKKDETIDSAKLVGKWKRTKFRGREETALQAEFSPKGVLRVTPTSNGGTDTADYKYKLTGAKLEVEMWKGTSVTMDVVKLTDSALHTKDEDGDVTEFERMKEKKDK